VSKPNPKPAVGCFKHSRPVAVKVGPSIAEEALAQYLAKIYYRPIRMKRGIYRTELAYDNAPHVTRIRFQTIARWVLENYVEKNGAIRQAIVWTPTALELPDDEVTVFVAMEGECEPHIAFHAGDCWRNTYTSRVLKGTVYAWATPPGIPPAPKRGGRS
jgi:hypothetical protein